MPDVPNIRVKDLGPISEASVDLKPLTVFIGPNNSGKSYMALAIYCLSRSLTDDFPFGAWLRRNALSPELLEQAQGEIKKAWPDRRSLPREPIKVREMSTGVQDVLKQTARTFADALSNDFGKELERCYGTELRNLVRRGEALSTAQLEVGVALESKNFAWQMQATGQGMSTGIWDIDLLEQELALKRGDHLADALIEDSEYFLMMAAPELAFFKRRELTTRVHYMPASRSGILLGHRTMAGSLVGQASRAWVKPIEIPRLTGSVIDLIQALLLLESTSPPGSELEKVIAFLERTVTKGTVDMDTRTEYPEIYYQNENGRFSLHQVSSMVSVIAPIVLFLKYLVRPGHLFIIEEPESNLDVANQMRLARAIAMLVNAGVKVLITTHSDFFVNQIDNLLLLSQVSARRRASRRYSAKEVLQPKDVGAYLFKPGPDGSVAHTLDVTADGGIPAEDFGDAHSALYNEAILLEHTALP